MHKPMAPAVRFSLGFLFLLLGIIGGFVPVMQGWMFFALALLMFFPDHPRTERAMARLEPKWPRLVGRLRNMGFGRSPLPLANLDLGHWLHEHQPHLLHLSTRKVADQQREEGEENPMDL